MRRDFERRIAHLHFESIIVENGLYLSKKVASKREYIRQKVI